jgi:hypothetical protein
VGNVDPRPHDIVFEGAIRRIYSEAMIMKTKKAGFCTSSEDKAELRGIKKGRLV